MVLEDMVSRKRSASRYEFNVLKEASLYWPERPENIKETYDCLNKIFYKHSEDESLSIEKISLLTSVSLEFHHQSKPFDLKQIQTIINFYNKGIEKTKNLEENESTNNLLTRAKFKDQRLEFYVRLYHTSKKKLKEIIYNKPINEFLIDEYKNVLSSWTDLAKKEVPESVCGIGKITKRIKFLRRNIWDKTNNIFYNFLMEELKNSKGISRASISSALGNIYKYKSGKDDAEKKQNVMMWAKYKKIFINYIDSRKELLKNELVKKTYLSDLLSMGDAKFQSYNLKIKNNASFSSIEKDIDKMKKYYEKYFEITKQNTEITKYNLDFTNRFLENHYGEYVDRKKTKETNLFGMVRTERKKTLKKIGKKKNNLKRIQKNTWKFHKIR